MNKIKYFRERAGLTQTELAEMLDVTRTAIAHWEVNRFKPRADRLPGMARILHCTIDEFF